MKRFLLCLVLAGTAGPAFAWGKAPYYGPMKRSGLGFGLGYRDRIDKDGSWRIDATTRGEGDAIDLALYRAAERAREAGYRYVFLLGGRWSKTPGIDVATLYARPSHEAVPPIGCKSRKATACYTADVAEVRRILGVPDGAQPGVAILDHHDEFGRAVYLSGYGTGGVATLMPGLKIRSGVTTIVDGRTYIRTMGGAAAARPAAISPAQAPAPAPAFASLPARTVPAPVLSYAPVAPVAVQPAGVPRLDTIERFERARATVQPVRGGNAKQGWTISD